MSVKVAYKDGVFQPLEGVKGMRPDQSYTVFSDEELRETVRKSAALYLRAREERQRK